MKIGFGRQNSRVKFTNEEQALLSSEWFMVEIQHNGPKDRWIALTPCREDRAGASRIAKTSLDSTHPWEMHVRKAARGDVKPFATEVVSMTIHNKVVYGSRPEMKNAPINKKIQHRSIVKARKFDLESLREAVRTVNEMKKEFPREFEISVDDKGHLKAIIMISF